MVVVANRARSNTRLIARLARVPQNHFAGVRPARDHSWRSRVTRHAHEAARSWDECVGRAQRFVVTRSRRGRTLRGVERSNVRPRVTTPRPLIAL